MNADVDVLESGFASFVVHFYEVRSFVSLHLILLAGKIVTPQATLRTYGKSVSQAEGKEAESQV